jgi:hypothetical protein
MSETPNESTVPSSEPAEDYPGPGHDTAEEVVGVEDERDDDNDSED